MSSFDDQAATPLTHDPPRYRAPIGLPIGAVSPAEIAVAIMAEITQTLRVRAEKAAEAA